MVAKLPQSNWRPPKKLVPPTAPSPEIPAPRHQIAQQRREVAQARGDQVAHFAAAFPIRVGTALPGALHRQQAGVHQFAAGGAQLPARELPAQEGQRVAPNSLFVEVYLRHVDLIQAPSGLRFCHWGSDSDSPASKPWTRN